MSKFQPINELLDKSNFTVIGYLSESEYLKNELLDDIKAIKIGEFGQFFDLRSKIRESKINFIEGGSNKYSGYFHFDIMNFRESIYKDPKLQNVNNFNKAKEIRHFSENLYRMSVEHGVKVIITSPLYNNLNNGGGWEIKGGSSLMYTANLSFHITKNEIKITKNRFGLDNSTFNLINGKYQPQQYNERSIFY